MINDKKLLSVWKENLFAEYENSIYWDALPEKQHSRVGLDDLVVNDANLPQRWMKTLLDTSALGLEVNPVPSVARKIKNLEYETLVYQQEIGAKSLGLGYPLFIHKDQTDPHKYIAAPLFIWQLDLIPQTENSDSWILRRAVDAPILPNKLLFQYLKSQFGIDLYSKALQAATDGRVTQLELLKITNEISIILDFSTNNNSINVEPCPSPEQLEEMLTQGGGIKWSGVLGHFPLVGASMIPLMDDMINQPEGETTSDDTEGFRQHSFSVLPVNAMQSAVLRALDNHGQIVVEGARGTGKVYNTVSIITNALANRAKILVVAPNKAQLKEVKSLLSSMELGDLAYILLDPVAEKTKLANALFQNSNNTRRLPAFEEEDYLQILNLTQRLQNKLDKAHEAISTPIFKGKNWTDVSGFFLKNHLKEGKQLLNSQLFTHNYLFEEAEYDELMPKVERGSYLYSKLNTLKHPLRVLNPAICAEMDFDAAKSFTHDTVEDILKKINDLYLKYVMHLEAYSDKLENVFEQYYNNLKQKASAIEEDIDDYKDRYGSDFNKSGGLRNLKLSLTKVFSKRNANILEAKNKVLQDFEDLRGDYEHKRYFAHVFNKIRGFSFDKLDESIKDFEQSLEEWKASIPTLIHHELQRLKEGTSHFDIDYKDKIAELDKDFEEFLEYLNNTNLYQKQFTSDADTLIKKRAYLEEVTEQIETLQYNLRDFDDYYNWTSFWLGLSGKEQDLLKALIKTKPTNWEAAFNSWYLHNLLSKYYSADVIQSNDLLEQYHTSSGQLKDFLVKKAQKYWKLRQSGEVRRVRKENKLLYNTIFGKNREKLTYEATSRSILRGDFDLISNMFPVFLTTPAIASEYLPQQKDLFDIVIVLGAEAIQAEEAIGALWRGKREVIFGDNQLGSIRNAASLLTAVRQANYKHFTLHQVDEFNDEKLLKFRNAAFYNNQLTILPQFKRSYEKNMEVIDIQGVYIPEEGVNREEAEQIMHLLNKVEVKENGHYPSVGIACFTIPQRNLLMQYLRQIKQHRVAGNEKIAQLEEAGLSVHHINDLQAHKFDVVIVSTTFAEDKSGFFPTDITQINEIEGLQGLNALTSCAIRKVIICTSISDEFISHYAQHSSSARGLNILSNYIAYANAVQNQDETQQDNILQGLLSASRDIHDEVPYAEARNFVNVVEEALQPYFEQGRIATNQQFDGLQVDFVINPAHPEQPPIAVQCDGFFWRFPKGAYASDKVMQRQLKALGYEYMPIWSVDWWKNPNLAGKKLAGQFIKHDEKFMPPPPPPPVVVQEAEPMPVPSYDVPQVPVIEDELVEKHEEENIDNEVITTDGEANSDVEEVLTDMEKEEIDVPNFHQKLHELDEIEAGVEDIEDTLENLVDTEAEELEEALDEIEEKLEEITENETEDSEEEVEDKK